VFGWCVGETISQTTPPLYHPTTSPPRFLCQLDEGE
jgi:hypothetical protein